jgi:hypothetical protein
VFGGRGRRVERSGAWGSDGFAGTRSLAGEGANPGLSRERARPRPRCWTLTAISGTVNVDSGGGGAGWWGAAREAGDAREARGGKGGSRGGARGMRTLDNQWRWSASQSVERAKLRNL